MFCDAGFFKLSTTCIACPVVPWPLLVFAVLLAVAVYLASKKRLSIRQTTLLKILFFYVQMVVVSLALEVDWPSTQTGFVEAVSLASGELGLPIVAECYVSVGWYASFAWSLIGLFAAVGSVWLVTLVMHWRRRTQWQATEDAQADFALMSRTAEWQRLFVAVAAGMHLPLIKVLLGAFACIKSDDGDLVVAGSDDGTSCTSATHLAVQVLSGVALFVFGIVGPIVAMLFVLRLRDKGEMDKAEVQAHWGALYEGYERHFAHLEGVVAIRKVFVTLSLVVPAGPGVVSLLLALQSGAWTLFVAVCRPYERVQGRVLFGLLGRDDIVNELEIVASSVVTLHQIVGGVSVVGNDGTVWLEVGVVLLVVTLSFLLVLVWQLIRAGRGREVNPSIFNMRRARLDQNNLLMQWSSALNSDDFESLERVWLEGVRHARQCAEFAAWKADPSSVRADDLPFVSMALAADETSRGQLESDLRQSIDLDAVHRIKVAAAESGHFDIVRAAVDREQSLAQPSSSRSKRPQTQIAPARLDPIQ